MTYTERYAKATNIAELGEIEEGFGCDPEYYGVSSAGAIAYHLRNEDYLPVEEESNQQ